MTSPTLTLEDLKHQEARLDFSSFLNFVRIQDTNPNSGTVEMPFLMWPYLAELALSLVSERLLVILKARQIGITWIIAAYVYWLAAYHPGVVALVISKGELESKQFISRMKFIHDRLPERLKAPTLSEAMEKWEFKNGSSVHALPASSSAGRSFTASFIFHDEADYHPDLESAMAASRPSIDGGGQHVMVSTANFERGPDSHFKKLYLRARDGLSTYKSRFYGWNVRPDRDEQWRAAITLDYEQDRRDKEYPETEQQALAPPSSMMSIPPELLDLMKERCRVQLARVDGQPADARRFENFHPGHTYAAFTDTSHGDGGDFFVTGIIDCGSENVVADIFTNTGEPGDLAWQSVRLLQMYDNPLWGIEDNDWGIIVINKAQELRYPRLYHRPVSANDSSDGRVGWTTNRKTRPMMINELRESCLAGHLTVYAEDGLGQFYDLAKNPNKDYRVEAVPGRHDDYPITIAGALMMKKVGRLHRSRDTQLVPNGQGGYELSNIFSRVRRKLPAAPTGRRW